MYESSNEGISRRWLCDRVAYLEAKLEETENKMREKEEECKRLSAS